MKKIENLNAKRFEISSNEMENLRGGVNPGHHKFLWWTWDTSIEEWEFEDGTYTSVKRCADPKKQGLTEDDIKSGLYTEFIPGVNGELIIE